jgi:hypothetical protein
VLGYKGDLSGYYAWLKEPQSSRALEIVKLSEQICYYYDQNMGVYGSPRIYHALRDAGVAACSEIPSGMTSEGRTTALQPRVWAAAPTTSDR